MTALFRKLSWWLRCQSKESELEEELQFYLDEEAEERRAEGLTAEEASRAAHLELGNVALVKEDTRAAWSWTQWELLLRDLRHTFRLLRRDIRLNAVIVCTIALGIAANTTMFSIVNAILLKSPVPDPERLLVISETHSPDSQVSSVSSGNFVDHERMSCGTSHIVQLVGMQAPGKSGNDCGVFSNFDCSVLRSSDLKVCPPRN